MTIMSKSSKVLPNLCSITFYSLDVSKPKEKLTRAEADLMPGSSSGPVASKDIKSNQEGISKPSRRPSFVFLAPSGSLYVYHAPLSPLCFYIFAQPIVLTVRNSLRNGHNMTNTTHARQQSLTEHTHVPRCPCIESVY